MTDKAALILFHILHIKAVMVQKHHIQYGVPWLSSLYLLSIQLQEDNNR